MTIGLLGNRCSRCDRAKALGWMIVHLGTRLVSAQDPAVSEQVDQ